MKKPNYKAFAKIEIKRANQLKSSDNAGAYNAIARASRTNARGYESITRNTKARKMYELSAQSYEQAGEYSNAIRMYEKAGLNRKAEQLRQEQSQRKQGFLDSLGISASILFLIIGILFISINFTGRAIFNLDAIESNLIGIWIFVFGLLGLLFSTMMKKSRF